MDVVASLVADSQPPVLAVPDPGPLFARKIIDMLAAQ
jgi:hypothetical protein